MPTCCNAYRASLQAAFEHCVRAYVIRSECLPLGSTHPDTAAAAHNLGVVLDCLGKSSRGLQLVEQAQQVLDECLGPGHPRSLAAARNAQHIRHKIIKLPAEPQELMQRAEAATNQQGHLGAARGVGEVAGRARRKTQSKKQTRQQGADNRSSSSSEADSSSSDTSNSEDGAAPKVRRSRHAATKSGSTGNRRGVVRPGSMQERLQAVSYNRLKKAAVASGSVSTAGSSKQQHVDTREYTDPDYLGSGVFKASREQRQLYEAVKADISSHARASSHSKLEPTLVEMQVVSPGVLPGIPSAAAAVVDSSSCNVGSRPPSAAPLGAAGAAGGQLARRGPLLDSTVAAVKKPLTVEEARRLRRTQQAAGDHLGRPGEEGKRKAGLQSSLVEKLF